MDEKVTESEKRGHILKSEEKAAKDAQMRAEGIQ